MASRFTDTNKWNDPWFRKLKPEEKLLFNYLCDNCDLAGFIEIDSEAISFQTGLNTSSIEGALKGLARGCIMSDGWVWIRTFLRNQKNDKLNPANPAHKNIISRINEQVDRFKNEDEFLKFIGAYKGLFSPIGIGNVKVMVEVKEGGVGETTDDETNSLKLPNNHRTQFATTFSDLEPIDYLKKHHQLFYESFIMGKRIPESHLLAFNDAFRYQSFNSLSHFQNAFKKHIREFSNGKPAKTNPTDRFHIGESRPTNRPLGT